jgi:hypothetical protein
VPRHQSDRHSVVAAVLASPVVANLAAALLRTQGVTAVVETAVVGAAPPAPPAGPDGVRLLVAPEDEERASAILRARGLI